MAQDSIQSLIILNLAIECWEGVGRVSKMNTALCFVSERPVFDSLPRYTLKTVYI